MKRLGSVSLRVASVLVVVATVTAGQGAAPPNPSLLKSTFGKLPIYFIENKGLYPDEVSYYVQGADKTVFFTKEGITFRLKGQDRCWVVKLEFVGANSDLVLRGGDHQRAVFSYFRGSEKDWKAGIKTYARVVYEELWPGIDLIYRSTLNKLKYEFVVAPGADPGQIRLRYRGATSMAITKAGALLVETPVGGFNDAPPMAYQETEGRRVEVGIKYELDNAKAQKAHGFGFEVGQYDSTKTLVLDPAILLYCGYVGGLGDDVGGLSIAMDAAGNAYLTGCTQSDERTFPVKVGPDLTFNGGLFDTFVAKVNAQGTGLVYCGYIGGAGSDEGYGIAVDAAGNAYVVGSTQSTEQTFPVRIGPDLTHNGLRDTFVAKVNAQGTALVYCGYIGGGGNDEGHGIALDAAGNAYVTGWTNSAQSTFPLAVGPDLTFNGAIDAFVAKVNPTGTALVYCGYIGGSGNDQGHGIALDAGGNACVTGETLSTEQTFPVTVGPDLTYNGGTISGGDAFVAKVTTQGSRLVYCGYIGGASIDIGYGIAVDAFGDAYLTGETLSTEKTFPVKVGPDATYNGGGATWPFSGDAFVAKVNSAGTELLYCGYIGGSGNDCGNGVAVDGAGNAHVTGWTDSTEQTFPVKIGPDMTYNGGTSLGGDAFVAKVTDQGKALIYCGYVGGALADWARGIAVDAVGIAYVTGWTYSNEQTFPVTVGPDLTFNGSGLVGDAFVAKISLTHLHGTGAPRPGLTVSLTLTAFHDVARPYQLASSLGTGPIPLDTRQLGLSPDGLLVVTVMGYWPTVFSGYRGVIDSKGQAQAAIHIPNVPALIGVRLHSAFVTLDPAAPSRIRSISNTFTFSVTK